MAKTTASSPLIPKAQQSLMSHCLGHAALCLTLEESEKPGEGETTREEKEEREKGRETRVSPCVRIRTLGGCHP
jgi:hypothetical protein